MHALHAGCYLQGTSMSSSSFILVSQSLTDIDKTAVLQVVLWPWLTEPLDMAGVPCMIATKAVFCKPAACSAARSSQIPQILTNIDKSAVL